MHVHTPDVLHQLYQGVVKHLIHWCSSIMTEAELDARVRSLLPCSCYRALLDFIYISQYPSHNKDSLGYLQEALEQYHANKHILIDIGVCEHFSIPKLHSMQHYTECIT